MGPHDRGPEAHSVAAPLKANESWAPRTVSEIFAYEWMGLRALNERYFEVFYGPVTVGFLDTFRHVFHRALSVGLRRRLRIGEE